uniref:Ig-like domain-containing protein n=1 Tax=Variovorax sp. YR752 TaxID=1884383 RepID=UPI003137FBC9
MTFQPSNLAADDDKNISQAMNASLASPFALQPPALSGALDNAGDIQNPLVSGSVTDDRQPDFHGQGTPGDTIVIQDNGTVIGQTRVEEDGSWSFTPSADMTEGHHAITLVARDAQGNESAPSAAFNFEIDVTPPDASKLSITGVADAAGGTTGNVISGGTSDDARPLISGTSSGVSGHTVIVMVKDVNGERQLGQAVIGKDGNWTLQVDAPLAEGLNTFRVYEHDVAGNETALTAPYKVTVELDGGPPDAPVIERVLDNVGAITGAIGKGGFTDDAKPEFKGKAEAGSTVKVYDGATLLGTVVADAGGNWTFTPLTALGNGAHSITVTATDVAGNTSAASASFGFTVDTVPPTQTATVTEIGNDSGFSASDFLTNDGNAGRDMKGVLSAALAANETLQVSTDGGTTWQAASVSGTQWTVQDSNSHTGSWNIQTRVVDAAGNGGPEQSQAVTLDQVPPKAPTQLVASGTGVDVYFDNTDAKAGDKVRVAFGDEQVDHVLTAADIAAGKVFVANPNAPFAIDFTGVPQTSAGGVSLLETGRLTVTGTKLEVESAGILELVSNLNGNILIADALSVQGPFLDFAVAKGTDSFAFDLAFGLNDA